VRIEDARCLVLGGGFLGTNLAVRLKEHAAGVTGFGRKPFFQAAWRGVPWIEADLEDEASLIRATQSIDWVFHVLGGSVPAQFDSDPSAAIHAEVIPALRLLEACRRDKVKKIVFVSSGGTVYGRAGRLPIPEEAPTEPITAYGAAKLAVEKYLGVYRHLHQLDHAVIRLANPYGPYFRPDRGQGIVGAMLARALRGKPLEIWGDGSVVRDFIFVEDAVDALIATAAYEGDERLFNVGCGAGRSVKEVAESVAALLPESKVELKFRPGRPADVPANVLDISRIRRETGWAPRTAWLDGLQRTAAWLRSCDA